MTIQSGTDPRDAEIARLRELLAERDAEIAADDALLAERNRILDAEPCPTHGPCVPHVLDTLRTLRAQLAAAQADNAALRERLGKLVAKSAQIRPAQEWEWADWACGECRPDSELLKPGWRCAYHAAVAALATPAPGAPLLDAVRGLVEAVESYRDRETYTALPSGEVTGGEAEEAALDTALAAVRAVLSPPQDTGGVSRGEDGE